MQGASFITIKRGADVSWPFKLLFKVADFHKDLCVNINSQNVRTRDPWAGGFNEKCHFWPNTSHIWQDKSLSWHDLLHNWQDKQEVGDTRRDEAKLIQWASKLKGDKIKPPCMSLSTILIFCAAHFSGVLHLQTLSFIVLSASDWHLFWINFLNLQWSDIAFETSSFDSFWNFPVWVLHKFQKTSLIYHLCRIILCSLAPPVQLYAFIVVENQKWAIWRNELDL